MSTPADLTAPPAHPGRAPHPVVYAALYYPFGALGGFVTVAMTFLATRSGLTITEGAFFAAAQLCISYLKWMWAPVVDVTLTPQRWFTISTIGSATAVLLLSIFPISKENLPILLAIVMAGTLVNSVVGMAVEAIMGFAVPKDQQGTVSGWFQVGNLGGNGVGGGLGLFLLTTFPDMPWIAGGLLGATFLASGLALRWLPDPPPHRVEGGIAGALRKVGDDIKHLGASQGGLLSAILCFVPVGTGAAAGVITQAAVAGEWGAGDNEVALMQGILAGIITAAGCLAGGALCQRIHPRIAYAGVGILLALIATAWAFAPLTVTTFVVGSAIYNFGVGLAYAAFTATVLNAMGRGSAATKYNLYASLSNFPIWWLGLLLAYVADKVSTAATTPEAAGWATALGGLTGGQGGRAMLLAEAALGVVGVAIFFGADRIIRRSRLPEEAEPADAPSGLAEAPVP